MPTQGKPTGSPAAPHITATIQVWGMGTFPFDMLRYDQACPATPDDAAKLQRMAEGERVKIRAASPLKLNVYARGGPTPERWASFLWRCEDAS